MYVSFLGGGGGEVMFLTLIPWSCILLFACRSGTVQGPDHSKSDATCMMTRHSCVDYPSVHVNASHCTTDSTLGAAPFKECGMGLATVQPMSLSLQRSAPEWRDRSTQM